MKTAYSYLRFSTAEQMKGDSIRRQESEADRACKQFKWRLSDQTFRDLGVSAFRGKHAKQGALSIFLDLLQAGNLETGSVLILEDFDRLNRDKIMTGFDIVRRILETGTDVFCTLNWKLYTKDSLNEPMAIMEMIWRFYLAHEESAKKAYRSKENWKAKHHGAENGTIMTKLCPAWLTVEDGKFIPIKERVAVVKQIFAWCVEGHGINSIVRKLNQHGIKPFRSSWNQKYIYEILTMTRVLGELTIRDRDKKPGQVIKGYYPAIIPETMFHAANNAIRARTNKVGRKGNFPSLFTGIVHYPAHDSTMVFVDKSNSRKKRIYRYLVSFKGFKGLKPYVSLPYDRFENVVLSWLREVKASDFTTKNDVASVIEELRQEDHFLAARIEEVAGTLANIKTKVPAVMNIIAELEGRREVIKERLDDERRKQTTPAIEDTKRLIDLLGELDGAELRDMRERVRQRLQTLIERIDVEIKERERRDNGITEREHYLTITFRAGITRRIWFGTEKGFGFFHANGKRKYPVSDANMVKGMDGGFDK